jgi:hypothetical protein
MRGGTGYYLGNFGGLYLVHGLTLRLECSRLFQVERNERPEQPGGAAERSVTDVSTDRGTTPEALRQVDRTGLRNVRQHSAQCAARSTANKGL